MSDAIAAAAPGDTVRIGRGTYIELLPIVILKDLTIESNFAVTADPADIEQTIIVGDGLNDRESHLFDFGVEGGATLVNISIRGLTLKDAGRSIIMQRASGDIRNIIIDGCAVDGVAFEEESSGVLEDSLIMDCGDDAVDIDGKTGPYIVRGNTLLNSGDDNLEARLLDGTPPGPDIEYFIIGNHIEGADTGDGIQIIEEDADESRRVFHIENNLLIKNRYAGVGTLPNAISSRTHVDLLGEPYPDLDLPERIFVVNNTIVGNEVGVHGGDNFVVLNNLIANNADTGALHIDGSGTPRSIVDHNLLFNNSPDLSGVPVVNQGSNNLLGVNPLLNANFTLATGSPAIDAGAVTYTWLGESVLDISVFNGSAPDSGAFEFDGSSGGPMVLNVRVNSATDDAEQRNATMDLDSGDLDMVLDGANPTPLMSGVRFTGINIPQGATVTNAYIQFQADEATSDPTSLFVVGQAIDDAPTFSATANDLSDRATTGSVAWNPPAWNAVGDAGGAQRTPDLTSIVQEIVNRPGWVTSNAMVFVMDGSGRRVAESFEGSPEGAALLHVEIDSDQNLPPNVDAGGDFSVTLPASVNLNGTVTDDGQPDPPGAFTTTWSTVTGPGSVTFADPGALSTTASVTLAGSYRLRLTADDGELVASDDVVVTVEPAIDVDSDGVPDNRDNCSDQANPAQTDADADGIGNACDPDVNNDCVVNPVDLGLLRLVFLTSDPVADFNGDGVVNPQDLGIMRQFILEPPGPSGVANVCGPTVLAIRVDRSSDDAEERDTLIDFDLSSSDLELTEDANVSQRVGIRFNGVDIPRGAPVSGAYIQFQTDEATSATTNLTFWGQEHDNAPTFVVVTNNISDRTKTQASVSWQPFPWNTVGEAGVDQRSPDLATIVQEIVDRKGWNAGNSLAFIVDGNGSRVATSYDGGPTVAPVLHIEFDTP